MAFYSFSQYKELRVLVNTGSAEMPAQMSADGLAHLSFPVMYTHRCSGPISHHTYVWLPHTGIVFSIIHKFHPCYLIDLYSIHW